MKREPLALVVAQAHGGVIGHEGGMPWHLPEDLKHFRRVTRGHAVIMGRKTHASIGRALPDRRNIVVTRDARYRAEGCKVVHSLEAAIALAREHDSEPRVIGGAEIYAQAMPLATVLYVTDIDRDVPGDAWFPRMEANEWQETERRNEGDMTWRTLVRTT